MSRLQRWLKGLFTPSAENKRPDDWTADDRAAMFGGEHLW